MKAFVAPTGIAVGQEGFLYPPHRRGGNFADGPGFLAAPVKDFDRRFAEAKGLEPVDVRVGEGFHVPLEGQTAGGGRQGLDTQLVADEGSQA